MTSTAITKSKGISPIPLMIVGFVHRLPITLKIRLIFNPMKKSLEKSKNVNFYKLAIGNIRSTYKK
jgi:hypothetical protein